jgi:uncharacterized membrane protein YeaQ/YmgE (transglycosylase-associated protein family)
MDLSIGSIIVYIVAGAIIGAVARLIMPGRQSMSIAATIALGVVAAVIGGILWEAIFPDNDGIAWIGSILVAVGLLWIYAASPAEGPGSIGPDRTIPSDIVELGKSIRGWASLSSEGGRSEGRTDQRAPLPGAGD